jgi:hypothetical protein
MKALLATLIVVSCAGFLPAQQPAADLKTFSSSSDVQALIAKAKAENAKMARRS